MQEGDENDALGHALWAASEAGTSSGMVCDQHRRLAHAFVAAMSELQAARTELQVRRAADGNTKLMWPVATPQPMPALPAPFELHLQTRQMEPVSNATPSPFSGRDSDGTPINPLADGDEDGTRPMPGASSAAGVIVERIDNPQGAQLGQCAPTAMYHVDPRPTPVLFSTKGAPAVDERQYPTAQIKSNRLGELSSDEESIIAALRANKRA